MAEELMKLKERRKELLIRRSNCSTFVNLVIGTLYCSKSNFEFGVSRIIRSLEPYNRKLGTDTWYYAKRCFLSLMEALVKHMIVLSDSSIAKILLFLDAAEVYTS
jgi:tetratricopeptide repeat protein 30